MKSEQHLDAGPYEGIVICNQDSQRRHSLLLTTDFPSVSETGRSGTIGTIAVYAIALHTVFPVLQHRYNYSHLLMPG
jgi:hypothetical protein